VNITIVMISALLTYVFNQPPFLGHIALLAQLIPSHSKSILSILKIFLVVYAFLSQIH
jgi:hypothetical protein